MADRSTLSVPAANVVDLTGNCTPFWSTLKALPSSEPSAPRAILKTMRRPLPTASVPW